MICENITTKGNELYLSGIKVADLAKKYGTPLFVMDENRIRKNISQAMLLCYMQVRPAHLNICMK